MQKIIIITTKRRLCERQLTALINTHKMSQTDWFDCERNIQEIDENYVIRHKGKNKQKMWKITTASQGV